MTPDWKDPITPFFWILGGTIILFLLLGFIILYVRKNLQRMELEVKRKHAVQLKHQSELLETSVQVQENERARIAANIHDDLIAQLHRIKLQNRDEKMNALLKNSIQTARIISHDLIPPLLEELSFKELVDDFVQPYTENYTIDTRFSLTKDENTSTDLKLQLFRISQEVITNIGKHAKANCIRIHYRVSNNYISLQIIDNGIGIPATSKKGLGMKTIELRSQIVKANYRFKRNKSGGTSFMLIIVKNLNRIEGSAFREPQ